MRMIVFINEASTVREILHHIGESTQAPIIAPARRPRFWEVADVSEQAGNDRQSDPPNGRFEFDQRIVWRRAYCARFGPDCAFGSANSRFPAPDR